MKKSRGKQIQGATATQCAEFCADLRETAQFRMRNPAYTEQFIDLRDAADNYVKTIRVAGNSNRAAGFHDSLFTPGDCSGARKSYASILLQIDSGSRSREMFFALASSVMPSLERVNDMLHLAFAIEAGEADIEALLEIVTEAASASWTRWRTILRNPQGVGTGTGSRVSDAALCATHAAYVKTGSYGGAKEALGMGSNDTIRQRLVIGEARGLFQLDRANPVPDDVLVRTYEAYVQGGSLGATRAILGGGSMVTLRLRLATGEARGLFNLSQPAAKQRKAS